MMNTLLFLTHGAEEFVFSVPFGAQGEGMKMTVISKYL